MSKDLFKKITAKNITAYQKRLADELKLSPATVKRRVSSIRKFCEWAQKQGYLETNPFLKRVMPFHLFVNLFAFIRKFVGVTPQKS